MSIPVSRSSRGSTTVYEILLERRAEKDLRRLAAEMFPRMIVAIEALADDP